MGRFIEGNWIVEEVNPKSASGEFVRQPTKFRQTIGQNSPHPPASGRYHLYVSLACPWAHRTLIFRALKGLEEHISLSVVHYFMGDDGWSFAAGPGVIPDPVMGATYMRELYKRADPQVNGRVTVPVLWDLQQNTIVNNESAEIIRIFNTAFNDLTGNSLDFYPQHLKAEIDAVNDTVYDHVNNGVYKAGFATTQEAYEKNVRALFAALDSLDQRLAQQAYLAGEQLTEADWRLFTTLIRFDAVYHTHFKCNIKRIADYPHLSNYMRALYQVPGIAETCDFLHIKRHYYESHKTLNPAGIVAIGPDLDLMAPHNRGTVRL